MHLVITDSGLGGLSICAEVARARARLAGSTRITYVNAWPEQGRGYNDLPGMAERARAFDRALASIAALSPDEVLIACNTLSVVYEFTEFRKNPVVPVRGIIDAGVELFAEALAANSQSSILLIGTRTTIESGVYRQRLLARGISAARIGEMSCHGLAGAIERGPASDATRALTDDCMTRAAGAMAPGEPSYVGLCCTHYALIAGALCEALTAKAGRPVRPLDPNARLVQQVTASPAPAGEGEVSVQVLSKVILEEDSRDAIAALIEPISSATAAALRHYTLVPHLF